MEKQRFSQLIQSFRIFNRLTRRCNNSVTLDGQSAEYLGKSKIRRETNLMKRIAVLVVGILVLGVMVWAQNPLLINGAGASFPFPIYSKWFDEYHQKNTTIQFNYQSVGSGAGIKQMTEGTVDFGASDLPMNDEQIKAFQDKHGS